MMVISQACMEDFEGVRTLLKANHADYIAPDERVNGFVTTNLTDAQLETLILEEHGVTIAKEAGKVLGFALAAPWEYWAQWPLFAYMIEHLSEFSLDGQVLSVKNSYQYGPVCIDQSIRGSGTFEKIFYASLANMRERYPIMATFINQANGRSYAAHTRKVTMTNAGSFTFNQNNYYLMACSTTAYPGGV